MEITTEQVKELRNLTGISVMQCKEALEEAGGEMDKAKAILEEKSQAAADKKNDRELGAGAIASYIHTTGSVGVLIELGCETDFVSKNEEFKTLARDFAMHIAASAPEFIKSEDVTPEIREKISADMPGASAEEIEAALKEKALLDQKFIKNPEFTIHDMVNQAVQKFGEKVEITRFSRFAV